MHELDWAVMTVCSSSDTRRAFGDDEDGDKHLNLPIKLLNPNGESCTVKDEQLYQ